MTDWMTRIEAAQHLRISVRHLNRLKLPRSMQIGSKSPRYSRTVLDQYMAGGNHTPDRRRKKGGPWRPPSLSRTDHAMTADEVVDQIMKPLRRR